MNFGMIILTQNIKTMQNDIADDVEKRYDTSNYEVDRPLPKGMNKKVIGLMKGELGGMIKNLLLLDQKHSYLTYDDKNLKKPKGAKKCVAKRILKFNHYRNCLFKKEIILQKSIRLH